MARISLTPPRTPIVRAAEWYSRRVYGTVLEPLHAMAHQPRVLLTTARYERSLARWNRLDPQLKILAEMTASVTVGCSWCMDFGYWLAHGQGVDEAKLRDVPTWRDSDAFTERERRVLEYAEAMSSDPTAVSDDLVERLREDLGEAALVELTMMVAVENSRSRFNSALGLASQGFKDRCELPVTRS